MTGIHRTGQLWEDEPGAGWRRYVIADVFTAVPLEGNQLAVFPDGRDLGADVMQRTARELNLSETVFFLPAEDSADVRLRIFTPAGELLRRAMGRREPPMRRGDQTRRFEEFPGHWFDARRGGLAIPSPHALASLRENAILSSQFSGEPCPCPKTIRVWPSAPIPRPS